MKQFTLILFMLATVLFASCGTQSEQPNIVIILVDDMGYGDPQCYMPDSKIPTPNIDKLATEGIRFTDAHSPSSVCTPTRYSILTGRYAWRTRLKSGVLGPYNQPLIEADRLTIPKMLKKKGYTTALIGKWHLGMQWGTKAGVELPTFWDRNFNVSGIDHTKTITAGPNTAGFETYFGVDVPNFPPYTFIENDKVLNLPTVQKPSNMYGSAGLMVPGWKLDEILSTFTTKAVEFIDNYAAKNTDNPFYLHVNTTSPHTPIVPAAEFIGTSGAGPYGDLVNQTDYTLGEILKALERNSFTENTLVIFTSDNGSPARAGDPFVHGTEFQYTRSVITMFGHNPNAPNRGIKADIYDGGHRIPFIVKWPGHVPVNKVSNEPFSAIDIMATLAKIVDFELPANSAEDSEDISQLFFGKNIGIDAGETPLREAIIHHSVIGAFAIRQGKWKMIPQKGSGGWTNAKSIADAKNEPNGQLYDLDADPGETNNLWEQNPEIVNDLQVLLDEIKTKGSSRNFKEE
ncbi:MAG: sulfatase-like hydrolase/transferase [Draconibacterium sp.]|nr:sulfatase-like hydrolase/transferase [Draconibacterium sp.]